MPNAIQKTTIDSIGGLTGTIQQLTVFIDTVGESFQLAPAVVGRKWYVMGINYGVDIAHTLQFLSDADLVCQFVLSGAVVSKDSLKTGAFLFTDQGDALNFISSAEGTFTITITDSSEIALGR
jgi:hypothetical protein